MRYSDILTYQIDVEDSILNCRILKLILQPIVENALYHGIKNKRTPGLIRVSAGRINGSKLCLEVIDNGNGMTKERLKEVVAYVNDDSLSSKKVKAMGSEMLIKE